MLSKLGRWTTQLAIAIGASLVYALGLGLLGSIYEGLTREHRSYAGQIASLEVTQDGQLAYLKYDENSTPIITTLSGEEIKDAIPIYAASVYWKRESNSLLEATWDQRVANFMTKGKYDVVWTLVLDQKSPARLYFTAVSFPDRAILGYLGRQGFQSAIPRPAEMIPFDYEHQDPYYFLMQAGFTFNHTTTEFDPNYRYALKTIPPQWPIVSEGQLLVVDFEKRTVTARPEVGKCHSLSMDPGPRYNSGEGSSYVVVQKDRLIVDPLGAARTIRLPPRLQQTDGFWLYLPETGEVLAVEGGITDRKYHITRFTDAGVITREADQTLPDSDIMRRQSQTPAEIAAIISSMFPIPLVLLIVAVITGEGLAWSIAAVVTAVVGLGVLLFISRWRKRTYSWSWIAAAILLGPCVGITLWATSQRRPAIDLAPPTLTGCEVFG